MTPYYDNHGVTLFCGDAREVLPCLPASSTDLLLTDPPYGQDFQSNRREEPLQKIAGDDGTLDVVAILAMAARKLGRGRHAYVFGPANLSATPLAAAVQLIWDKDVNGTGDLSLPWGLSHEPITFAVYEPSAANRAKGYGRLAARMRQGSVIRCQRLQGAATGRHPNEKPVTLLRQLIEASSVAGDTVLDCFSGVGSTLVAAMLEGRRAVGIEVSKTYCEAAVHRVEQAAAWLAAMPA